jgi:hypothetical protein
MTIQDLSQYKGQHGRIIYRDKFGEPGEWFGYIKEINYDHLVFQDNETPHKFKIHEVIDFKIVKLPNY